MFLFGYYSFVKGDAHSEPLREYFLAAKGTADITEAEAETPAVEFADEVVEPEAENINDNAESETADTTEAEAESVDENNYGTSFPNSNGGRTTSASFQRSAMLLSARGLRL